MANYQGGGAGQRTYENAWFTPKAKKSSKSKGKSKSSSKPSRAQSVQEYLNAMPRPPANYQVPLGNNFLTQALAAAGGPNKTPSLAPASYTASPRPTIGYNDVVPGTNPFLAMMQKAGIQPARTPSGGVANTSGALAGGAYGAGGSVYNSQVPHAAPAAAATAKPASLAAGILAGAGAGAAGPPQSAVDILAQLTADTEYHPQADNTDWQAQATSVYKPQTDYLNNLDAQARAQAKASGKSIDQVYDELTMSIGGNADEIKKNYAEATKQGNAAYDQAYGNSKKTFDNSRNGVADTLQRLGIEEAAPNTAQQGAEMQQLMQGIIGANDLAQDNAMTQGRQSALDYNEAMKSGATIRGGDAQAALTSQLNGFLNELGGKKADLAGQIQQMAMQGKSDAEKTAYDRWRDSMGFNLDRQKMAQDAGQYSTDLQYKYDELASKSAADPTKLDPIGSAKQLASRLYGNNQAADNALNAVTAAISEMGATPGTEMSLQGLWNTIEARLTKANGQGNVRDLPQLKQIAAELFKQSYGK